MATVAVLADPPVDGFVLPEIAASTPLSEPDATRLYTAMLTDVCRGVQDSGPELLVNYRDADQVPGGVDPESALRDVLDDALERPGDARYEVQVGDTFAGRAGNTVTHLLEEEGETSVAVVEPTAPFLQRPEIGSAAMKMRSSDVVLGPTGGGRVYYAGFGEPIDFDGAYEPPAIETLTQHAADAGLDVDFLPMQQAVETPADLAAAVARIRSLLRAGRNVPVETATVVTELGLYAEDDGDGLSVGKTAEGS